MGAAFVTTQGFSVHWRRPSWWLANPPKFVVPALLVAASTSSRRTGLYRERGWTASVPSNVQPSVMIEGSQKGSSNSRQDILAEQKMEVKQGDKKLNVTEGSGNGVNGQVMMDQKDSE